MAALLGAGLRQQVRPGRHPSVFIVLWFVPSVSSAFFGAVIHLTSLVGIDPALIFIGQAQMRFR